MPRITLIHATPLAVEPVNQAFRVGWPEASTDDMLDANLAPDLARDGGLTEAMIERFEGMAETTRDGGADAILFTCSAFGPAIEAAARRVAPLPTLKPNEAMFAEAIARGGTAGLLATFAPALEPMTREFRSMAKAADSDTDLHTLYVFDAIDALSTGDGDRHDSLLAEEAKTLVDCTVLMLAQFSMARAKARVEEATGLPVLTSPDSAVRALKARLAG